MRGDMLSQLKNVGGVQSKKNNIIKSILQDVDNISTVVLHKAHWMNVTVLNNGGQSVIAVVINYMKWAFTFLLSADLKWH